MACCNKSLSTAEEQLNLAIRSQNIPKLAALLKEGVDVNKIYMGATPLTLAVHVGNSLVVWMLMARGSYSDIFHIGPNQNRIIYVGFDDTTSSSIVSSTTVRVRPSRFGRNGAIDTPLGYRGIASKGLDVTYQMLSFEGPLRFHQLSSPSLHETWNEIVAKDAKLVGSCLTQSSYRCKCIRQTETIITTPLEAHWGQNDFVRGDTMSLAPHVKSFEPANPDQTCDFVIYGDSPMITACRMGNMHAIQMLLHYGANTEVTCETGKTALYHSILAGRICVTRLLLGHGASVQSYYGTKCEPLVAALNTFYMHKHLLRLLVLNGASVSNDIRMGLTVDTFKEVFGLRLNFPTEMTILDTWNLRVLRLMYDSGNWRWDHKSIRSAVVDDAVKEEAPELADRKWAEFPRTLKQLCVLKIRSSVIKLSKGKSVVDRLSSLPVPSVVRDQILLRQVEQYWPEGTTEP